MVGCGCGRGCVCLAGTRLCCGRGARGRLAVPSSEVNCPEELEFGSQEPKEPENQDTRT